MSEMTPIDKMTQSLEFLHGVAQIMHPDLKITQAGRRALAWLLDELAHALTTGVETLQPPPRNKREC